MKLRYFHLRVLHNTHLLPFVRYLRFGSYRIAKENTLGLIQLFIHQLIHFSYDVWLILFIVFKFYLFFVFDSDWDIRNSRWLLDIYLNVYIYKYFTVLFHSKCVLYVHVCACKSPLRLHFLSLALCSLHIVAVIHHQCTLLPASSMAFC